MMLSWVASLLTYAISVGAFFYALPATMYLGVLALLSRRIVDAAHKEPSLRFGIVVPAHNESAQILQTVESLLAIDYPKEMFEVVVVADNCEDDTAAIAKKAGARVLERQHATERGKGYALNYAFGILLGQKASAHVDALIVVDADTIVSKNLLHAFAARLLSGELAVQAEYGVRNPDASWRTRLMAVALAMFHRVRSLARERMGVSAGLRGNGMCFSRACLNRFPHEAHGLVEDVEYGILLGRGGVRVAYADEAQVLGEMVSGAQASESQRERWEGGRAQLVAQSLRPLLSEAIKKRSLLLFDLALDLATPPLGRIGGMLGLGLVMLAATTFLLGSLPRFAAFWLLPCAGLGLYIVRGIVLSNLGFRAVTALMWAPVYLVWKVLLAFRPKRKNQDWVRTRREAER